MFDLVLECQPPRHDLIGAKTASSTASSVVHAPPRFPLGRDEVAANSDENLNFFSREASSWAQPQLVVSCSYSWSASNWRLGRPGAVSHLSHI